MHEALFYRQSPDGRVVCELCHHRCRISEGKRGICGVREHRNGRLYSLVYGRLVSENIDPIEKKPLFHVVPGSRSYSIATVGCNFQCLHCQNYQISQYPHLCSGEITGARRTPQDVVDAAQRSGCAGISYTYVEPTIFYEFAYDCAKLAKERGLKNVFVSNGYMTGEVVQHLAPVLDGINIDLKAFTTEFYQEVCKARLEPVVENIRLFHSLGVLVEVTTLLIPGLNDSEQEVRNIARFLQDVSADIPWHVSGFYPTYKMQDRPATPAATIARACAIGREEGLHFVYAGNVGGAGGMDTHCPGCGALLVQRVGFGGQVKGMHDGACSACGLPIVGIWS
ncbi:AmmeMemoRadiSam system radical SAM enzyme [Desulfobulbus oligotrophicus]|uniref:AmmeMemoRadiSam system radical SAM enzyme n=1 Tax=Desulfobulbus oligotrophicus TaxID=1909699 RepID=A0A7T5VDP5_9BACT|nr:AmmeMemoRadiSam system radical SAM enzyme [Desulfobulbus oligotrophicus]QQG65896.1 AmmeMemoRadiSam system radical SAM enzyme [Desulfobulbus oligotrophicus]